MDFERLWAPWRIGFIKGERSDPSTEAAELPPGADAECFLCHASADTDDRKHLVVTRDEHSITGLVRRLLSAQGFNIGMNLGQIAGAGLPGHLLWHIVPRWSGDTNFMPTLAGTRVIPQSLEELWQVLDEACREE